MRWLMYYATIAMAKLVKTRQPRLFDYLFTHRNKHKLMALIDVPQMETHGARFRNVWSMARQYQLGGTAGVAS